MLLHPPQRWQDSMSPQKVRITPSGQVTSPIQSGRSPHEVRVNPPSGQVKLSKPLCSFGFFTPESESFES
jgi:hypothetical protein